MKRDKITINNSQVLNITDNVRMSIPDIAELFGVFYQVAKRAIRSIEKSGIATGDSFMNCTIDGRKIYPNYYGLEMIIAVAFHLQSPNADIFRKWVIRKMIRDDELTTFILTRQNTLLN